MDLPDTALNFAYVAAGAAGSFLASARMWVEKFKRVEDRLAVVEEKRLAGLESRVESIEHGCAGKHEALAEQRVEFARLLEEVKNLVGWTKRMDMRLERLLEDVPALKTDLAGKGLWLGNLNEAMRQHVQDRSSHGGE